MDHDFDRSRMRFAFSSGIFSISPDSMRDLMVSLHIWSNIFFHISVFRVVRVTHNMVYPVCSNDDDAAAIALQVLPDPGE